MTDGTERKENPGRYVFGFGLLTFVVYTFGGLLASENANVFFAFMAGIAILTVFLASVVGAYYAGKRRR